MAELARVASLPKAAIDPRLPGTAQAVLAQLARHGSIVVPLDPPPLQGRLEDQRAALRAAFWLAHAGIVRIVRI
jgi:hypothetical protein